MPVVKFSDKVANKILEGLRNGEYVIQVCADAGITRRAFYDWVNQGTAAKSGKKKEFAEAVKLAREEGKSKLVKRLDAYATAEKDWRGVAWRLERLAPAEFAINSEAFANRATQEELNYGDAVEGTDSVAIDDEVRRYWYGDSPQQGAGFNIGSNIGPEESEPVSDGQADPNA